MIYECIQVQSYEEQDSILNEEGDLDNESEDSDFEEEMRKKWESTLSNLSTRVKYGSLMSIDEWDNIVIY